MVTAFFVLTFQSWGFFLAIQMQDHCFYDPRVITGQKTFDMNL